jgi:sortase B
MENNENEKNKNVVNNGKAEEFEPADFLSSLDNHTVDKNGKAIAKKKRTKSYRLWVATLILCITVFVVSAVMLGLNIYEGYSSKKINEELNQVFLGVSVRKDFMPYLSPVVLQSPLPRYGSVSTPDTDKDYQTVESNNPVHDQLKQKLTEFQQTNPDIFGWIQVDGTNISYAVVKGNDNSYYLNHTVTKKYNANGAIFVDYRCEDNILDNPNLVIYGHNSPYLKQMFNQLQLFLDKSFFKQNKYITMYTIDGVYRYEIFAIYETYSTYKYSEINFESNDTFVNWCKEMKENSLYKRDSEDFTPESRIITLSTCTGGYYTRRYSLQGRLVRVEK